MHPQPGIVLSGLRLLRLALMIQALLLTLYPLLSSRLIRQNLLCDLGAALMFFGSFATDKNLAQSGQAALAELIARGYQSPSSDNQIRIYPRPGHDTTFASFHSATWSPGRIVLRNGDPIALRHELMHELSRRTCAGQVPLWAEEAAAIAFSGEHLGSAPPQAADINLLREQVGVDARLSPGSYQILSALVSQYGWPMAPCQTSPQIAALLESELPKPEAAHVLVSLATGRILEQNGDMRSRAPPGSLLKLVVAAALEVEDSSALGQALARSDTPWFLEKMPGLNHGKLSSLLGSLEGPSDPKELLGERSPNGQYPYEFTLLDLASLLRQALLVRPDYLFSLFQGRADARSTLAGALPAQLNLLNSLRAVTKTGTVSNAAGAVLYGSLAIAWPAEHPVYLAVVRQPGVKGSDVLRFAVPLMERWKELPPKNVTVEFVRNGSNLAELIGAPCDIVVSSDSGRFSKCGLLTLLDKRRKRHLPGLAYLRQGRVLVEMDMESYADAVLSGEGANVIGQARRALRAVIVWNGINGGRRHAGSVCDTTHCAVFDDSVFDQPPSGERTSVPLLGLLNQLGAGGHEAWLQFSKGGAESWTRHLSRQDLLDAFETRHLVVLQRQRNRTGQVSISLDYGGSFEELPCETVRSRLKLPSCPDQIIAAQNSWIFSGTGAGHGLGLNVARASALSASGKSAEEILVDAYGAGSTLSSSSQRLRAQQKTSKINVRAVSETTRTKFAGGFQLNLAL